MKKKPLIIEETVLPLPCALTEHEVTTMAREAAKIHGDIASRQKESKDTAQSFKAQIEGLRTRLTEINRKIESNREDREIRCKTTFNYADGTKTIWRLDLNEEVATLKLAAAERQMGLPLPAAILDPGNPAAADRPVVLSEAPPEPGTPTGTDDVRTPAAESVQETEIRVWFNSFTGKAGRKLALGIIEETAENEALLTLGYKKLTADQRGLVRSAYAAAAASA